MELNDYQNQARQTFIVDDKRLSYLGLGLNGEAGEVAERLKKRIRDNNEESLKAELGDVLWYTAVLADELGYDLNEIASGNLAKLHDRAERNKLHGDGDDR
jgi:NTP pyrophosphatase (non-canonical NTP hydrolase)